MMLFHIGRRRGLKKLLNTLYVTNPEAYVCKGDDALVVRVDGEKALQLPFHLLEGVVMFGYLGCSPAVLGACTERGITISFLDDAGRFLARVEGPVSGSVLLRRAQYRASDDPVAALILAQRFVAAKVRNARTVLQRCRRDYPDDADSALDETIEGLKHGEAGVFSTVDADELRGVEGDAARRYFAVFDRLLRAGDGFVFSGRTRRPPRDPVNALLSFFYSLLAHDVASACETVGLDPQVGFFHRDRPGRASLALDVMEELRAWYVDRFVVTLINRRQVSEADFSSSEASGVTLSDTARKSVLGLWQRRKQEQVMHPFLKERVPVGLVPFLQVQLLARYLRGDLDDYPAFIWR